MFSLTGKSCCSTTPSSSCFACVLFLLPSSITRCGCVVSKALKQSLQHAACSPRRAPHPMRVITAVEGRRRRSSTDRGRSTAFCLRLPMLQVPFGQMGTSVTRAPVLPRLLAASQCSDQPDDQGPPYQAAGCQRRQLLTLTAPGRMLWLNSVHTTATVASGWRPGWLSRGKFQAGCSFSDQLHPAILPWIGQHVTAGTGRVVVPHT